MRFFDSSLRRIDAKRFPDAAIGLNSTTSRQGKGSFEVEKPHRASVSHLYRNNHDGMFTEVPRAGGLDRTITVMVANLGGATNINVAKTRTANLRKNVAQMPTQSPDEHDSSRCRVQHALALPGLHLDQAPRYTR